MFMKLKNVQYYCYDNGYSYSIVTLFRMGIFGAAHVCVGAKRPPSIKSVTHILQ